MSHWVTIVYGEKAVPKGFKQEVQWLALFFYANNAILASPQPACL